MSIEDVIRAAVSEAVKEATKAEEAPMAVQSFDKTLFKVSEAAELLSLSKAKIYQLIHIQGFPVVRVGRKVLLPLDKVVLWLEKNGESLSA